MGLVAGGSSMCVRSNWPLPNTWPLDPLPPNLLLHTLYHLFCFDLFCFSGHPPPFQLLHRATDVGGDNKKEMGRRPRTAWQVFCGFPGFRMSIGCVGINGRRWRRKGTELFKFFQTSTSSPGLSASRSESQANTSGFASGPLICMPACVRNVG